MGCDIHIVLERRSSDLNKWVGVQTYKGIASNLLDDSIKTSYGFAWFKLRNRNYDFFNDLCGVRGEGSEFGHTPRGLPDDASDLALMEFDNDSDLHSHSWLSARDFCGPLAASRYEGQELAVLIGERMAKGFNLALLNDFVNDEIEEDTVDEYRLVFAFDN